MAPAAAQASLADYMTRLQAQLLLQTLNAALLSYDSAYFAATASGFLSVQTYSLNSVAPGRRR